MKEEIFIPLPISAELEKVAAEEGMTTDAIAEKAMRNYIDRSDNNGR